MKYDFSGYATKNDLLCADGRVIRQDAFKHMDGKTVPLVWQHGHSNIENIIGHALLENRPDGVYTYGVFNETQWGQNAKTMVKHGDLTELSIYANHLTQQGTQPREVVHGFIREVSLVLAGANPGARIDNVCIQHSDGMQEMLEDDAIITTGNTFDLAHSDLDEDIEHAETSEVEETVDNETSDDGEIDDSKTVEEVFEEMTEEQKNVIYYLIADALGETDTEENSDAEAEVEHADDRTVGEIFDSMTEIQKQVAYAIIGYAVEEAGVEIDDETEEDAEHSDSNEGDNIMKHNVFVNEEGTEETLSHADVEAIFNDAKRYGSLEEAALAHGITEIEYLFPDAKTVTNVPDWIKREDAWVSKVMNGTHHTPFSRIKSIHADITEDDARALGYLPDHTHRDEKGNLVDAQGRPAYKKEEVFGLLKRTTTPTTVYKKQKLDRDDVIDITDFDVVAWIKTEMRMMLNEEIARAILIGDGRLASSDDKINEQNIRPIWKDADLYTVKYELAKEADPDARAKKFIRQAIKARKNYKGSGNPTLWTTEDMLTDMLLLTDNEGRDLYDSVEKLATKLRVKEIVTVPVMEGAQRTNAEKTLELLGLFVNLNDYNVGADKGGQVSLFDDFDIDYNAQKYLIETRCSGAMIKPYGAFAIEIDVTE